jgi:5-formyltetrahydrofolate cyclo-ligase
MRLNQLRAVLALLLANHYICARGAARCVRSHIPGALSILKGAVPDRARGLGHMAPTYFRREPGIDAPTAIAAPRFCSMQSLDPIVSEKAALRRQALTLRNAIPADTRAAASLTIAERPLPFALPENAVASGFMPLKGEINPLHLMRKLSDAGARLALPVVAGRGKPLVMRAFAFGDPLTSGVWGIREPRRSAPELKPDILLVPLLAFDRSGYRIGYGAGYYDLTINALRSMKPLLAVGIAFAAQEIPQVLKTARDARLDLVLTERETIRCP